VGSEWTPGVTQRTPPPGVSQSLTLFDEGQAKDLQGRSIPKALAIQALTTSDRQAVQPV